jgi:hypothetical protein
MLALIVQHPLPFIVLSTAPSAVLLWRNPFPYVLQRRAEPVSNVAYWAYRAYAPVLVAGTGFVLALGVASLLEQNLTGSVADVVGNAVFVKGPAVPILVGIIMASLFLIQNPIDLILKANTNDRLPKKPRLVYCSHTKYAIPLAALGIFCAALMAAYVFDKEMGQSIREAVELYSVFFCISWSIVFGLIVALYLGKVLVGFPRFNDGLDEFNKKLIRVTVGFGGEIVGESMILSLTMSMVTYAGASFLRYLGCGSYW